MATVLILVSQRLQSKIPGAEVTWWGGWANAVTFQFSRTIEGVEVSSSEQLCNFVLCLTSNLIPSPHNNPVNNPINTFEHNQLGTAFVIGNEEH